jgi:hypothetical protein
MLVSYLRTIENCVCLLSTIPNYVVVSLKNPSDCYSFVKTISADGFANDTSYPLFHCRVFALQESY